MFHDTTFPEIKYFITLVFIFIIQFACGAPNPLPCCPAAPSSHYPAAAASPHYHSAIPSSSCFITPLPAPSHQLLLSATLPACAPHLVHPIVLVVVVPVVPTPAVGPLTGTNHMRIPIMCFHCTVVQSNQDTWCYYWSPSKCIEITIFTYVV